MRTALVLLLSMITLAGCAGRQVEVRSEPSQAAQGEEVAIHLTNNLTQAVNVYVVTEGSNLFVKQVAANSTEHLPVRGIASGARVRLRATTADGTRTFTSDEVSLTGTYPWRVP